MGDEHLSAFKRKHGCPLQFFPSSMAMDERRFVDNKISALSIATFLAP